MTSIDASHITSQVADELTALEDQRWRQRAAAEDRANKARANAAAAAQPAPAKSAPKPPKPAPTRVVVERKAAPSAPSGSRIPAPRTSLPPEAGILVSADEMESIDAALDYWLRNHPSATGNQHSTRFGRGGHERF